MDDSAPQPSPEPASAGAVDWQELFAGPSPRAVLARLVEGDPLGIRARCEQRVRLQSLLLEVRRLQLRTIAHVARHAAQYRGTPPLDAWIADKVRKALGELLDEDDDRRLNPDLPEAPTDARLLAIAHAVGMEPEVLGRGLAVFNRSPHEVRSAFCGMVLDRESPETWAATNSTTPERAKTAVRRALWILGVREELDLDDLLSDTDDGGDDDA